MLSPPAGLHLGTPMNPLRSRRFRWLAATVILLAGFGGGYAWTVATPKVGKPYVRVDRGEVKLWTFGFVGDTQLGESLVPTIFRRMREANCEFVLHLGDIVDEAASDAEWDRLLAAAEFEQIRLMPVVGNHDRLRDRNDTGEVRFGQYFPKLPGTFYHFRHRGLNFLMLNSERSLVTGSEQSQFIAWQLEHHPGPVVVCIHRPVFTCGQRDWANVWLRRVWVHGALKGSDAVAVLSGHNHYYDRSQPLDGITYVVSGGGSTKLYAEETPDEHTAKFVAGRNHYGLIDVYSDHLSVRVIDLADQVIDQFDLGLSLTPHEPGSAANRLSMELTSQQATRP